MDHEDVAGIERIISDREHAHRQLIERGSQVYEAFLKLEQAAYGDGALSRAYKELTAIGISVVVDCESRMEWHIGQALRAGASDETVLEAIEIGAVRLGCRAGFPSRPSTTICENGRPREARPALLGSRRCGAEPGCRG